MLGFTVFEMLAELRIGPSPFSVQAVNVYGYPVPVPDPSLSWSISSPAVAHDEHDEQRPLGTNIAFTFLLVHRAPCMAKYPFNPPHSLTPENSFS